VFAVRAGLGRGCRCSLLLHRSIGVGFSLLVRGLRIGFHLLVLRLGVGHAGLLGVAAHLLAIGLGHVVVGVRLLLRRLVCSVGLLLHGLGIGAGVGGNAGHAGECRAKTDEQDP